MWRYHPMLASTAKASTRRCRNHCAAAAAESPGSEGLIKGGVRKAMRVMVPSGVKTEKTSTNHTNKEELHEESRRSGIRYGKGWKSTIQNFHFTINFMTCVRS